MRSPFLVVVLGILLLVGLLVGLDVIPLGLGGGSQDDGTGDPDLLGADGESESEAALKGRGVKPGEKPDPALTAAPSEDFIAATVRGTTPNGAAVRGRVVQGGNRFPVAGARVTLGRPDSIFSYLRAQVNGRFDQLEARTGSDGRFAFLDVTPSQGYVVRAQKEGFATVSTPDPLDLRGRESMDIGDLVFGTGGGLTGRVVDGQGAPVEGARVAATWRISNPISVIIADVDLLPELERVVTTDEKGLFTLDLLEPGPKTLIVQKKPGPSHVTRSFKVPDAETRTMEDIVLDGEGVLAGKVLWTDGAPVTGARIFGAPENDPAVRTVETGADGAFRLEWLPEAPAYTIGVLVDGLPVKLTQGFGLGLEDIVIELDQPGTLKGRVVREKAGTPITRFAIQLTAKDISDFMQKFVTQQVNKALGPTPFQDGTGTFEFPRVASGHYTVKVTAEGFPPTTMDDVTIVAGEVRELLFELLDGNVGGGRVFRANGDALAEARLYVFPAGTITAINPVHLHSSINDREPDTASRSDGSFELPPQAPGTYDVIASHATALPAVYKGLDLRRGGVGDVEIRLSPAGAVKGQLLDEHARPVTGERVYVLFPDGIVRVEEVDAQGRFGVEGLPIGPCIIRWLSMKDARSFGGVIRAKDPVAKRKAYDELRQDGGEHHITDGETTTVSLRLPRRVKVSGRVRVAGEVPKGSWFWLTVENGGNWVQVEFDKEGHYERQLEPGAYKLWMPDSTNNWEAVDVVIPDGPTFKMDIDRP